MLEFAFGAMAAVAGYWVYKNWSTVKGWFVKPPVI